MSEFKGTKGMFEVRGSNIFVCGTNNKVATVCVQNILSHKDLTVGKTDVEKQANTLLLSKAPELLEMLKSVLELQEENYGRGMDTHIKLYNKAKEIKYLIKEATELK